LSGHGRKQFVFVAKVPIGRIVGHARPARLLSQGEACWSRFGDETDRRLQQGFSQIAMVVRPFPRHTRLSFWRIKL